MIKILSSFFGSGFHRFYCSLKATIKPVMSRSGGGKFKWLLPEKLILTSDPFFEFDREEHDSREEEAEA